jgi:hypothetical protein
MNEQQNISIPIDLLGTADNFTSLMSASALTLTVNDNYESFLENDKSLPEIIAIQRLITLARKGIPMRVNWGSRIANQVFSGPSLFPLLAVLLCLDCSAHFVIEANGILKEIDVLASRKAIYNFRPLTDLFSDSQVIICSDSRGHGRPKSLYNSDGTLVSRSDFDAFIERLLAAQIGINVTTAQAVKFSQSVSTIVAELFENTDLHGKQDLRGVPFKNNGLRGVVFKRIDLPSPTLAKFTPLSGLTRQDQLLDEHRQKPVALEISVFDSGVGYYSSYMRAQLIADTALTDEWRVVHRCLERHYDEAASQEIPMLPDTRAAHTGMGLYEVLRALQFLKGKFEVRSGRTYGFRTFLEGETQFQIESSTSNTRPGMPRPVLLDNGLKFVRKPTPNEMLVGSTVRVLIPLN